MKNQNIRFPNFFRFIQNFYIKNFIKSVFLFVSITHSEFTDDFFFFFPIVLGWPTGVEVSEKSIKIIKIKKFRARGPPLNINEKKKKNFINKTNIWAPYKLPL